MRRDEKETIHDIASLPGFKELPKEERDVLIGVMKRRLLVERRKLELLSADRCANNLETFVKEAWPIMYGKRPLSWNWHLSVGCEMLQAMKMGQLHRLLMCWPPRTLKSNIVSVFYPPFVWTDEPQHQFISISHKSSLAERDAGRSRRMMQNEWYLKRWGDGFWFAADQNAKARYVNSEGGHRISQGIMSGILGEDADCLVGETTVITKGQNMMLAELHEEVSRGRKIKVLSFDHEKKERCWKEVLASKQQHGAIIKIKMSNDKQIRTTERHRFYHTFAKTYIPAYGLERGDLLQMANGDSAAIASIFYEGVDVPVYDIQVEGTGNFFANEILVHNSVIIDDINDPKKLLSERQREKINDELWPDVQLRLNNQTTGNIIVMMQRVAEGDLAGHIIENDRSNEYTKVIFPLEFEDDHPTPCKYDVRKKEGEPLDVKRFPPEYIDSLKNSINAYIYSGRFQQRPSLRGGNILMRDWWQIWTEAELPSVEIIVISIDTAFQEKQESDFTACSIFGLWKQNPKAKRYNAMLMGGWHARLRYGDMKARVIATVMKWTVDDQPPDAVLIENKASGQSLIQDFADGGIDCIPYNPGRESLLFRANIVSDILEDGQVWVPGKPLPNGKRSDRMLATWAEPIINECEKFPKADHDDWTVTVVQFLQYASDCGYLESSLDIPTPDFVPSEKKGRETIYG